MLIGATAWFDADGALDFEPILFSGNLARRSSCPPLFWRNGGPGTGSMLKLIQQIQQRPANSLSQEKTYERHEESSI